MNEDEITGVFNAIGGLVFITVIALFSCLMTIDYIKGDLL